MIVTYSNASEYHREKFRSLVNMAKDCGKYWNVSDMELDTDYNTITVWVNEPGIRKVFYNADTLVCMGTKC